MLYTEYLYPFEVAAVLLLVAIIAAISLTMRRREGLKIRDPADQVAVDRADRVRIVSMAASPPPASGNDGGGPGDDSSGEAAEKSRR